MDRIQSLAETAAEAVYNKTSDRRIIVLYPRHRQHPTLISLLQKYYGERLLFFSLNEEDNNIANFVRNLSYDAMFPIGFGDATRAAMRESHDITRWGEGFAQDLHQHLAGDERIIIMIDNFDVMPRDDASVQAFFGGLAKDMPENIQILINGRELRRQPWAGLVTEGYAVALGDDETLGSSIFKEPDLRGQLEVYALVGGARVMIDGRPITAWEGSLPRNLFYFFIDKPMVTRSEVFESFWPNLGIKEATNVFHVTKRKISEKLGYDLTNYENGYYSPHERLSRYYDVALFEKQVEYALKAKDPKVAEEHWLEAVRYYKSQFLKEVDMEWALERRIQLRNTYTQALMSLAKISLEHNDLEAARAYLIRATGEKPEREDTQRLLMQTLADMGRHDEIHAHYKFFTDMLHQRLNISPSQETQELYQKLTR
jgi:DNA-binding SARP family transcriptional activator